MPFLYLLLLQHLCQFFLKHLIVDQSRKLQAPGDQLQLDVRLKRNMRGIGIFECQAMVDGEIVAAAQEEQARSAEVEACKQQYRDAIDAIEQDEALAATAAAILDDCRVSV